MSPAPLLQVNHLKVARGGVQVLDIPALGLEAGTVLALIGPNGSGKTTLLKTLAGLLPAASGLITFQGEPLDSGYRRRVTMVFQAPLLFDTSVRANLESGLRLHHVPAAERRARVQEEAERFGLTRLLDRSARNLSGGEAQRASLARAFALKPELLFLDEPFAALDPPTREALLDDLAQALGSTRTTAVLATHDQQEALRLSDRIAVLHQGRILQEGPARDVLNHPADALVAAFVGMEILLSGQVTATAPGTFEVTAGGQALVALGQAALGEQVRVGIRPEHVALSAPEATLARARNHFPGTVTRLVPKGPLCKVELDCGFHLAAYVTFLSLQELGLAQGSEVLASFQAGAVHVLRG